MDRRGKWKDRGRMSASTARTFPRRTRGTDAPIALTFSMAGTLMTPEEFDAVEDYDEQYHYELVNGVLVVTPIPLESQAGPNEYLGYLLYYYLHQHPRGTTLNDTL